MAKKTIEGESMEEVTPVEEVVVPRELTKIERMKQALDNQPKVRIIIPKEASEKGAVYETVQLNGYTFQIRKGIYVDVPEQVANIIMDAQQQTEEAFRKAAEKWSAEERPELNNA